MLNTLLRDRTEDETELSVSGEISKNYALIDYAFLQKLDASISEEKDPDKVARMTEVREAVNAEMASRMQLAAEAMKEIVQAPNPIVMEGKIVGLARKGRIDDALVQLLQANLEQAQAAGEQGRGAVQVLSKLQDRVRTEMDKNLQPEVQLLRRLMRMDDSDARKSLMREKMRPPSDNSSKIDLSAVTDRSLASEEKSKEPEGPEVPPRNLAAALQEIKARFGNVDEQYDTGFVKRFNAISEEAETVALELAGGKELSAKEAQDLFWEKKTVSVWDLEQVEELAHQDGNFAVWEDEAQAQMARQDEAMRKESFDFNE
jgi:hypothetical protein